MASPFERQLKRLGLFGLSRLTAKPRPAPTAADLGNVRRILVVRPDERIGNAILIIPLLNALKQRFPKAQLALIMSRRYWELREFIPSVDEFIAFDKRHYARNPFAFVGLIRRLRRGKYDSVFDAAGDHEPSFTHMAMTALSGGRFRIGHAHDDAASTYDVAVPVTVGERHATERHLDLLRAIASIDVDPRPLLKSSPDSGFAQQLWQKLGWRDDHWTVIIHPGARGPKRWPSEHFAEVARLLGDIEGVQIGVVWGPSDVTVAQAMMSGLPDAVHGLGILSFSEFVSVIRHSEVFLSADCGPMHLAAAAPPKHGVVTVFTTATRGTYRAQGPNDVAVDANKLESPARDVVRLIQQMHLSQQQPTTARRQTVVNQRSMF